VEPISHLRFLENPNTITFRKSKENAGIYPDPNYLIASGETIMPKFAGLILICIALAVGNAKLITTFGY